MASIICVKQFSGAADEWESLHIFVVAGAFTDENEFGFGGLPSPKTILLRCSQRRQRVHSPMSARMFSSESLAMRSMTSKSEEACGAMGTTGGLIAAAVAGIDGSLGAACDCAGLALLATATSLRDFAGDAAICARI